jgi:hypothetical protein
MDGQLRVPKRNHHQGGRYFWGGIQTVDEAIIIISRYVLPHTAFSLIHVDRLGCAGQLRRRRRALQESKAYPTSDARGSRRPSRKRSCVGQGGRRRQKFLDLRKGVGSPAPFWKRVVLASRTVRNRSTAEGVPFSISTHVVEPLLPQFIS